MKREERIEIEEKRIKSILKNIPKNVKKTTEKLVKRAAFLLILTEDMEEKLKDEDFLKTTINASQEFIKANPLLKEYRDTIKSYQAVIKQLTDLALIKDKEEESKNNKPDGFIDFCLK